MMLALVRRFWFALPGFLAIAAARKNLIIDTDIFSDVDDAGALLLAATSLNANLLAVNVNYPSSYSALAASAILAHYGHADVPVGIRRPLTNDTFFDGWQFALGEFASKIAYHWSGGTLPWGKAEQAWDPVKLYRKALAEAEGAVTIASIGFLENLSGLLNSTADAHSPLAGRELIVAKVDELVVMGGEYPSGHEFNFWGSNASLSAHVVHNWPGAITFLGLEVGLEVLTGVPLMEEGPANDPVRAAYIYYTYLKARFSWDPLAVLYAIDGLGERFVYGNERGYNRVYANGSNEWVDDAAVTKQHWLKLKVDNVTIANDIDKLFLAGAWSAPSKADAPANVAGEPRPHEEL